MTRKNLPPLEVGTTYQVSDFSKFEFLSGRLTGEEKSILRLHLKNGTILEIPAADADLHYLQNVLMEAFPRLAIDRLKARWGLRDRE